MKILMFGHKHVPGREGGVEIVVAELASRMAAAGHEITLYNRKRKHTAGESPCTYAGCRLSEVYTVNKRALDAPVYAYFATRRAVKQARREKLDVIHVHAEGPCLFLRRFGKIGSKRRAGMPRIVVTIHGLDWQRGKWGGLATRVLRYAERQAVKYADEIIVLTSADHDYFEQTYGRETTVIPNGVAPASPREAEIIKEKWGLGKGGYVLFLARIVPEKGLHYLIEAWQSLRATRPAGMKLVIAGGASHDDAYQAEIDERCLADESILMTGHVEGALLAELYSNALLYVLPSDLEGMPMTLLEALSYGTACLVSDIPACRAVVGEGYPTFRHGDVADLAEKLSAAFDGSLAIRGGAETHTWEEITERTLALYGGAVKTETETRYEDPVYQ